MLIIFRWSSIPGRIGIWKCWFLQREENQRKTLEARERTNKQLYSHDGESGNRTRVTVVRGKNSHRYATHASRIYQICLQWNKYFKIVSHLTQYAVSTGAQRPNANSTHPPWLTEIWEFIGATSKIWFSCITFSAFWKICNLNKEIKFYFQRCESS
jgi:hypothetical protein